MSTPSPAWLSLLAFPLSSCILVVTEGDWDGHHSHATHSIRGSGIPAEEHRDMDEFSAIDLETCATVVVKVGEEPYVQLTGDDNLLSKVETSVEDGVLKVELSDDCSFRSGLELVIGIPSLERFTIEGSGDVRIEDLESDEVELAIEGSGTLHAHGSARSLVGSIEGSGSLSLADLVAEDANLSIEGSGSIEVRVASSLRYSIEGSGDILYTGEPELEGRIDGSGNIEKRARGDKSRLE